MSYNEDFKVFMEEVKNNFDDRVNYFELSGMDIDIKQGEIYFGQRTLPNGNVVSFYVNTQGNFIILKDDASTYKDIIETIFTNTNKSIREVTEEFGSLPQLEKLLDYNFISQYFSIDCIDEDLFNDADCPKIVKDGLVFIPTIKFKWGNKNSSSAVFYRRFINEFDELRNLNDEDIMNLIINSLNEKVNLRMEVSEGADGSKIGYLKDLDGFVGIGAILLDKCKELMVKFCDLSDEDYCYLDFTTTPDVKNTISIYSEKNLDAIKFKASLNSPDYDEGEYYQVTDKIYKFNKYSGDIENEGSIDDMDFGNVFDFIINL